MYSYPGGSILVKQFLFCSFGLTLFSACAFAATVYDSGTPQFVGTNITQVRAADSFTLGSSANLTDVRFYASAFTGNTFPGNFSGSISYAFYNDSSGSLGSVIASGTVNGLSGALWGFCGSNNCYTVDLALNSSLAVAAGTYWLELHEGTALNTSDGTAVSWAGFNNATGSSLFSGSLGTAPNVNDVSERAFLLFDNSLATVPEPASFALIGGGLAAMVLIMRKRMAA
jgi:hypothetical protein